MKPPSNIPNGIQSQLSRTKRPLEAITSGGYSDNAIPLLSTMSQHQEGDHSTSLPRIRFSVNRQGRNKNFNYELLTTGFEDIEGSIFDLANCVLQGFAITGAWLGGKRRKSDNCLGSQVVLLDIDNSEILRDSNGKALKDNNSGKAIKVYHPQYSIEQAKADPNFQAFCAFAYTSPSHKPDWHRFRIVIPLPRWLKDWEQIDATIRWCQQQFPGCDIACKDRARLFYGNTNTEVITLNPTAGISEEQLDRILAEVRAEKATYEQKIRRWQILPNSNLHDREQLIENALNAIDPDCPYEEWLAVGMALHTLGDQWLLAWDRWSSGGAKYRFSECQRKWRGFSSTGGITLGSLFWIAKQYGWEFPQRDDSQVLARIQQQVKAIMLRAYRQEITLEQMESKLWKLRKQAFGEYISNTQWLALRQETEDQVFRSTDAKEQFQEWQGFERLKHWVSRMQKLLSKARGFGEREQPLSQPKLPVESIEYRPGNLPKHGEYIISPKIFYKPDQLPQLIQEARSAGWEDLLDTTAPGGGKSHRYASLSPSTLGVKDGGRAWLLCRDHRNPTTAPAEHNYADMPVRTRTGFVENPNRKTATGKSYLQYPTKEEAKSLHKGNCHMTDLIHAATAKAIESASQEAQFNPFCAICKHKDYCGQRSGLGYGYRHERKKRFEIHSQIRSSIDSLPEPANYQYKQDVAILDEPMQQLKPVQVINADAKDVAALWDELEYQLPQVAQQLALLKTALAPLVRGVEVSYHGFNHEQLRPLLPPIPQGFADILNSIRAVMVVNIEALTRNTTDTASTQEETERIALLKAKIRRRSEKLEKLQTELTRLQNLEDGLLHTSQQLCLLGQSRDFKYASAEAKKLLERLQKLPDIIAALETDLTQLRAELTQHERERQMVRTFNHLQYHEAKHTLSEKIAALPNQWLVPFLEVWSGSRRGALRINPHGSLSVTIEDCRHNCILDSMNMRYYLDATGTPEMLSLYRQIPTADILWLEQKQPPVENLDLIWVTGFGLAGKYRSESCDARLKIFHSFLKEQHPDLITFDWKVKKAVLGADGHYFSDSTRGTNEFISCTVIAAIGLPMPDVAVFYDLWFTINTNESLSFDDFYYQLVNAEIIQEIGRLRANRRPNEKLTFYLIGDTEKCRVADYQPPAKLKPRRMEVRDLCPAAASKSEQAWLCICEVIRRWWTENGELPTQHEVSAHADIDRSWISKLAAQFIGGWKCLKKVIQSLVNSPYNRWTLMEPLPEDFEWIAKTYLPLVTQNPSLEVAQELNGLLQTCGWQSWVQILSQTSQALRLDLITALFRDAWP